MKKIGIFFGSDTGNTEKIAKLIQKYIGDNVSCLYDISNTSQKDIEDFNFLIFGVPTWYYGEVQCDWDDFLPTLKKINFSNKIVALFGCGDQEDYSEYFCDAIGTIYDILKKNKANIIGKWSTEDYYFEQSKALLNKKYFYGLILDEDRQANKTEYRIKQWVKQIIPYFNTH
ncbi:flavodoxin FldA [Buchnera aphidicola str. APS (Acyrthosiphon pisum)]|uniref:Flavodoxin n=2 Tax=Buchnera aphidicola TaxID=9 RepID=FLAV_BUCAI|nr:flavodoxin FldA [Buchnera aphidicola]P57385.1 RecName: Full=Flavodoxin [Buchnera aphidicola str. APS (Acyrthosiphon pisum)]pir/H84964/ flavodoxin 1 [imported] - Buchnera sp. (strain APS) [Buchnera sp. (in: enterobacteria)]ADP66690.1 flavodoxin FldA [Buchnera aphidicola str. TLW03 (Acyrthosiphon pisum)]ADP67798.1 flavodoxin FldA [Buchnera aphidicola str. JF98 (Acyrthosiphon pisum)]OQX99499.1 MAG: flavodoxin [Erwiniaceae bacterium 4572_131]ACL30107.1 flavodoxin [Buchnera aphidicola str. Tuc7